MKNGEYMAMMAMKDSIWPYGRIFWHHEYRDDDHDTGDKQFLGQAGPFGGHEVVEIICRQEATARFVARHLYNFFVADEVPVPQWSDTPPRDPDAIDRLAAAYFESDHDIRSVLRVLFNSDFFKQSRFTRVKSPTEVVIGTLRRTGEFQVPDAANIGIFNIMEETGFMGQKLLDPPSVEGWHTGEEWITSGSLVDRVNFAAQRMSDASNPGISDMVERVTSATDADPDILVDACIDVMGPMDVDPDTQALLVELATIGAREGVTQELVLDLFKLIASSREYQLC